MDFFSAVAPLYDRLIPMADLKTLRDLLDLPCKGNLLDLGGGTGRVSWRLREEAERVIVADRSLAMLKKARSEPKFYRVAADAVHLPFRPASFACVLVVDALHHFSDREKAIAELVTVLAWGGRVVVEEPDITRPIVKVLAWGEKLMGLRSRFLPAIRIAESLAARGLKVDVRRRTSFVVWITGCKEDAAKDRRPMARNTAGVRLG